MWYFCGWVTQLLGQKYALRSRRISSMQSRVCEYEVWLQYWSRAFLRRFIYNFGPAPYSSFYDYHFRSCIFKLFWIFTFFFFSVFFSFSEFVDRLIFQKELVKTQTHIIFEVSRALTDSYGQLNVDNTITTSLNVSMVPSVPVLKLKALNGKIWNFKIDHLRWDVYRLWAVCQ